MSQIASSQLSFATGATAKRRLEPRIDIRSRHSHRLNPPGCGVADGSATTVATTRAQKCRVLTTLREKLIKIGAKVTRHSKYVFFQLAEVAVTRNLFAAILDRIERLALPPPPIAGHGA